MRRINIATAQVEYDDTDPEGFRSGMARLGKLLGAKESGISVYEIPPGQSICPYHYEVGEEEWLLVLEGTPTLRHYEGSERLDPWDVVCFPRGPEGAHGVPSRAPASSCSPPWSCPPRPSIPTATRSGSGPGTRRPTSWSAATATSTTTTASAELARL